MAAPRILTNRELDEICLKYKFHLARWSRDPVAFCLEAFHPDMVKIPQYWQAQALWALPKHRYVAIAAGHGVGKATSIDTRILQDGGYCRAGDVKAGEEIYGDDGKKTKVISVHKQGVRKMFKVTLDDGTSCRVDGEHLWTVKGRTERRNGLGWVTLTTSEIVNRGVLRKNGKAMSKQFHLPPTAPVAFTGASALPLAPYVVGAWLGNGVVGTALIVGMDEDVFGRIRELGHDVRVQPSAPINHHVSGMRDGLVSLGLFGCHSYEKSIPYAYKYARTEDRREIMRGLMDTDGTVDRRGMASYTTTSRQLADDVAWMFRSLGMKVTGIGERTGKYRDSSGEMVICRQAYTVHVRLTSEHRWFWAKCKQERLTAGCEGRYRWRWIASIEEDGEDEAVCFTIDNETKLYLVEDFIPTHNSFLIGRAAWWVLICKKILGEPLKVPCTGPSGGNIEDVLWTEVRATFGQLHPFLQDEFKLVSDSVYHRSRIEDNDRMDDAEYRGKDAWFARLRVTTKDKPENLQGFHGNPTMWFIDEAPGVPDPAFEVMRGSLQGSNTFAFMFGNPRLLHGYFYNAFHNKKSMWHTINVSCLDNTDQHHRKYFYFDCWGKRREIQTVGRVSQRNIEEAKEEFGENSPKFAFRILGQFPRTEEESLISPEWVAMALKRSDGSLDPNNKAASRYMGVDVAYQGSDFSSICVRCGNVIEHMERWQGHDPVESATRVLRVYEEFLAGGRKIRKIFVDDLGVGAGVTAVLRQGRLPAIGVMVGEACPDYPGTKCKYVRDWLWWQCRIFFQRGNPKFAQTKGKVWERLIDSLPMINYEDTGKAITVESKKMLKKRLQMRSPDECDSLCLTFYRDPTDKLDSVDDSSAGELMRLKKRQDELARNRYRKKKPPSSSWKLA